MVGLPVHVVHELDGLGHVDELGGVGGVHQDDSTATTTR